MNYFNEEQMAFLSKYEDIFKTSVFGNFKHQTNILTDKKIGDMYTKVTGETLGPWSCNTCNLNNYKLIGKLYYATKKYLESNGRTNKTGNGEITTEQCTEERQVSDDRGASKKGHTKGKVKRERNKKISE